jgi:hypothetical protein
VRRPKVGSVSITALTAAPVYQATKAEGELSAPETKAGRLQRACLALLKQHEREGNAPAGTRVTLLIDGPFAELRLSLGNGKVIEAWVPRVAFKIINGEKHDTCS